MITAWRITNANYQATAMNGDASSRYGGRWNNIGTKMVYLAESKALAAMEIMVHVDRSLLSVPYVVIPVTFNKDAFQNLEPLPRGWGDEVYPISTAQAGDKWIASQELPLLRVPSAIVPGEFNYLLNPDHPDTPSLNIGAPQPFVFDTRLKQ